MKETKNNKKYYDQVLADVIKHAESYTAHNGKLCYRTFGSFEWYIMLCSKLNLKIKTKQSGLYYTAENHYFSIDYVEHDIIIHIKPSRYNQEKEKTRDEAIEWHHAVADTAISMGELARAGDYFLKKARRFGLVKEFKENGII